eukprot:TRINITY_DN33632_c0_g1_i1.p1 TRINITY_DN33632_c0_g1~~TRINITY_DN33632_c0_g1_i1.p1  ORF type:complete len:171 (+),score=51.61 TRINITY_DN33632_c0_g1_i1:60-572(+)
MATVGRCLGRQARAFSTPKNFWKNKQGMNVKYKFFPKSMSGPPEVRGLRLVHAPEVDPHVQPVDAALRTKSEDGYEMFPWTAYANAIGLSVACAAACAALLLWGWQTSVTNRVQKLEIDRLSQRSRKILANFEVMKQNNERQTAMLDYLLPRISPELRQAMYAETRRGSE